MIESALNRYERRRSLVGVIAAMAVVNLVYGITFPLLALVLDAQGVSKTLIGLSTITQAAAVIVIAPWAPGLLRRVAPSRVMQTVTVVLALLLPKKPRSSGRPSDYETDPPQRQVRSAPHATMESVRHRFREIDARLQRMEKYLTSSRFKLDREFESLKD